MANCVIYDTITLLPSLGKEKKKNNTCQKIKFKSTQIFVLTVSYLLQSRLFDKMLQCFFSVCVFFLRTQHFNVHNSSQRVPQSQLLY